MGVTNQHRWCTNSLQDYGARYYLPSLRRFISADTVVPGAGNPQALNRFSYVLNQPTAMVDPTGHFGNYVDESGYTEYSPTPTPNSEPHTYTVYSQPSSPAPQFDYARPIPILDNSAFARSEWEAFNPSTENYPNYTSSKNDGTYTWKPSHNSSQPGPSREPVLVNMENTIGYPEQWTEEFNPMGTCSTCTLGASRWLNANGEGFPMVGREGTSGYTDPSFGWWLNPRAGYSYSWENVDDFVDFWLNSSQLSKNAQIVYDISQMQPGDVIAYRDDPSGGWDHVAVVYSVSEAEIIVGSMGDGDCGPGYYAIHDEIRGSAGVYDDFLLMKMPYDDADW